MSLLLALVTVATTARPALQILLNQTSAPIVMVGGINDGILPSPERKVRTCRNSLTETFDEASNKNSWREVGMVPHTRKCLTNSKVRHDKTDKRDPNFNAYQDVQSQK